MIEMSKGTKFKIDIRTNGSSKYFLLTPEICNFLSIESNEDKLECLLDEGKHGNFLAVFKAKKK